MKRTQFGWIFLIVILIIISIVIYQDGSLKSIITISLVSLIVFINFYKLTIKVTDEHVSFSLGIGLIKGKYSLKDINYCKPISYFALGWGIRLRPGVILFNVSGNKAIELDIKNKNRKVWIGTDSPDEISEYINLKRNKG
jgi:hypothetical protein